MNCVKTLGWMAGSWWVRHSRPYSSVSVTSTLSNRWARDWCEIENHSNFVRQSSFTTSSKLSSASTLSIRYEQKKNPAHYAASFLFPPTLSPSHLPFLSGFYFLLLLLLLLLRENREANAWDKLMASSFLICMPHSIILFFVFLTLFLIQKESFESLPSNLLNIISFFSFFFLLFDF